MLTVLNDTTYLVRFPLEGCVDNFDGVFRFDDVCGGDITSWVDGVAVGLGGVGLDDLNLAFQLVIVHEFVDTLQRNACLHLKVSLS